MITLDNRAQSDLNAKEADISSVPVETSPLRHTAPSVLYCLLYLSTHAYCICGKIQQTVQYRRVLSGDGLVALIFVCCLGIQI